MSGSTTIFVEGVEYYLSAPNTYTRKPTGHVEVVEAKAVEPVKTEEPIKEPVKTEEPVKETVKEPVKKHLVGFAHTVKQVTTDVHSFELYLAPEIWDFISDDTPYRFDRGSVSYKVHASNRYSDEFNPLSKEIYLSQKTFRGRRVDLMKLFKTMKPEHFTQVIEIFQAIRIDYEKQSSTETESFEGLQDL